MALEIKCPRCDKRYSALRAKCPYCGAYKRRKTRRTAKSDNAMWKTIVASSLALVLSIGIIYLTRDANREKENLAMIEAAQTKEAEEASLQKDVTSLAQEADEYEDAKKAATEAENGEETVEETVEEEVVAPEIPVESVKLYINNKELAQSNSEDFDYDISVGLGASYTLTFSVVPETRNGDCTATWSCTDTGKLAVLQSGKITGMTKGTVYLYCTVENAQAKVIVRVG